MPDPQASAAVGAESRGAVSEDGTAASGVTGPPPAPAQTAHLLPGDEEELTSYERERAEQMRRNRERMMALAIPSLADELAPAPRPPPAPRGLSAKRKREPVEAAPRRMSLRQRGIVSDGLHVASEHPSGGVVVGGGAAGGQAPEPQQPRERHSKEDLQVRSLNGRPVTDDAFIRQLASATGALSPTKRAPAERAPTASQLNKLKLREIDVAKVTRNGVVHLAFHPCSDALIIAAGDKSGHVGLWNVDYAPAGRTTLPPLASGGEAAEPGSGPSEGKQETSAVGRSAGDSEQLDEAEADGADDGVLEFAPHNQYICGLRWAGGGSGGGGGACLYTASYDGSVRCLDPGAGRFRLVFSDADAEFSAFDVTADGRTALVGDVDGNLEVVDVRAAKPVQEGINLHAKRINTLHVEPGAEQQVVSACSDNSLAVWDLRRLGPGGSPLASASHSATCQAAYWAPDGSRRVLSTSRDNTLRIWDATDALKPLARIAHNNNTGRWISPFRAVWGPASDCLLVGNLKRMVDVYNPGGSLLGALASDAMSAIPSRSVVHPNQPVVAAATASGRMHIFR